MSTVKVTTYSGRKKTVSYVGKSDPIKNAESAKKTKNKSDEKLPNQQLTS